MSMRVKIANLADDVERCAVAERLRDIAGGYVTIGEIEMALGICLSSPGVDLERDARNLRRLADLIEPSCDRDALLELAEELERPMRDGGYSKRIACRIREALGVEL